MSGPITLGSIFWRESASNVGTDAPAIGFIPDRLRACLALSGDTASIRSAHKVSTLRHKDTCRRYVCREKYQFI